MTVIQHEKYQDTETEAPVLMIIFEIKLFVVVLPYAGIRLGGFSQDFAMADKRTCSVT